MISKLINTFVSAIVGEISTVLLEKRKELKKDKEEKKKLYEERPELQIVKYKNHLSRPGHKLKKKCDINVFMTKIENVSVEDDIVTAHYNKEFFNEEEWCCVIYDFKNVGKTDIQCVTPISTYKKGTMLCNVSNAQMILEQGFLNYSTWYDRKVRVGESFKMRICYHKDCIVAGTISSIMVMGIKDCNNRFWEQPLFVPDNKIYETYEITQKVFKDDLLPDAAIECFKKPWLW